MDARIAKTALKRTELLTVLSDPSVPLHNNASELQARVSARRRDVSLHSRSLAGVRAMDIFTTLVQTSKKLGVSAYAYLRDLLRNRFELPSLADTIKAAAQNMDLLSASLWEDTNQLIFGSNGANPLGTLEHRRDAIAASGSVGRPATARVGRRDAEQCILGPARRGSALLGKPAVAHCV